MKLWNSADSNHISDIPNEYLLIHYESDKVKQQQIFGDPWTMNGMSLQLVPWQWFFEPTFKKLSRAMVWV